MKKIAETTSKLVPIMTGFYLSFCIYIIFKNNAMLPAIFKNIFDSALNFKALGIGIFSTLIIGMQKGIFSSEVGLGTGAIAAATADTKTASDNGLVQTFGIHLENLLIATITTVVICMSNYQSLVINDPNGIEITLFAFKQHLGIIGVIVVIITICLFALSTIFTGYYYGESSLKFIKNTNKLDIFILKIVTLVILVLGATTSSKLLWSVVDVMVGILAIINIYAIFGLRKIVIDEYKYYSIK